MRAQIAEREVALKRARDDYHRRHGLQGEGVVPGEELSNPKDRIVEMQASLAEARQQLNANLAQISGTTVEHIRRF